MVKVKMDFKNQLDNFTTKELEEEIKRRAEAKPKLREDLNFNSLVEYVETSMQHIEQGKGFPKDFEHWIYEITMETLYGPGVWKWVNKQEQ